MTTNLRVILRDFVLYQWVVHVLMLGYGYLVVYTVLWYTALKDPTAMQFSFAAAVFGVLPVMVNLYTAAISKLPQVMPPELTP